VVSQWSVRGDQRRSLRCAGVGLVDRSLGNGGVGVGVKAPFVYFGGKAMIADRVWAALGDVAHFLEPFFGSGAVLLARPVWHENRIESVCDLDGHVANVWRALQHDPDAVAKVCDWPVNHCDLNARRVVLNRNTAMLGERLSADPDWFDVKLAGYWVWAASCWIGAGLTRPNARPHIGTGGKGVHAMTGRPGPDESRDVRDPYNTSIYAWFRKLSERLRYVRVVCGDWQRICGGDWQANTGMCGLFFDPPYAIADRDSVYGATDSATVAHDVRTWCLERGSRPDHRIVLAGYEEHAELTDHGWTVETWSTMGGYGKIARNGKVTRGQDNRHRERLYLSPHCLRESSLWETHAVTAG